MTSASKPPEDDLPRDPAFDDAWRALSAEEPPAAIDAAMRAAARREVDAGPRIAVADRDRGTARREAGELVAAARGRGDARRHRGRSRATDRARAHRRPRSRRRRGLRHAAFAVCGAQRIREKAGDRRHIECRGAGGRKAGILQPPAAPAPPGADRKDAEPPAEPSASASGGMARKELQSPDAASAFPSAAPADKLHQETRKDSAAERKRDAGENVAPATPAANAEAPAPAPARGAERAAAPAVAPTRAADAFPADRANRGDATTKREASEESVARAPAAAGVVSPSTAQGAADQPAPENRTVPLAKLKAAPPQAVNEPGAAPTDSASLRREQARRPARGNACVTGRGTRRRARRTRGCASRARGARLDCVDPASDRREGISPRRTGSSPPFAWCTRMRSVCCRPIFATGSRRAERASEAGPRNARGRNSERVQELPDRRGQRGSERVVAREPQPAR